MTVGSGARPVHSNILRETAVASAGLGVLTAALAGLAGQGSIGLGIALGLVLGATNGYLIVALLDRNSSFMFSSLLRLAVISSIALGAAFLLQKSAWTVLIGVGVAQLVMVVAGVRQGLRA